MKAGRQIPVTAIVLTYNEEKNIERCLNCLKRIEDIVVVDSYSTDETIDAAYRARQNVRVLQHPFVDFGQQRNWALDNVDPKNRWVLFVDADEFCSDDLIEEIGKFVTDPGRFVGAYIAGKNYFLNSWLKYSTMYPSYQLRLLERGNVRYKKEGHGQREKTDGPLSYLKESWRHEGFSKGVYQWIERHNQYSSEEVELILRLRGEKVKLGLLCSRDAIERRRAWKIVGAKMPMRPLSRFVYTYFLRFGFLDGFPGFLYCCLRISHDLHIVVKIAESKRDKNEAV